MATIHETMTEIHTTAVIARTLLQDIEIYSKNGTIQVVVGEQNAEEIAIALNEAMESLGKLLNKIKVSVL